jgi:hypothetical protein
MFDGLNQYANSAKLGYLTMQDTTGRKERDIDFILSGSLYDEGDIKNA